jgi:adenylate kinase family enzyme
MSGNERITTGRRAYLFSVGIEEYREFRQLWCCSADAEAIWHHFGNKLNTTNRVLLISESNGNESPDAATVRSVLESIRDLRLSPRDAVFFYFAGHGFSRFGRDYLACSDTSHADLTSGVCTEEVLSAFVSSGAGTAVLIVDAGRNQAGKDVGPFGEATSKLARQQGTVVFFGCSPAQTCQELLEFGHGVFTYSILKAIHGQQPCTPTDIDRLVVGLVGTICEEKHLRVQRPYTCIAPPQKASLDIFTGEFVRPRRSKDRECLLIVGPSNSGKTTLRQQIASRFGMVHLEMSSFAFKRYHTHRKRERFAGSIHDFMEEVVWRGGRKDTIAADLVSADAGLERVVICGPRTVEEVDLLRRQDWNCRTIFLYADDHTRFDRYCASGERDRCCLGYDEFVSKDLREYGWGLAKTANMDNVEIVINEGALSEMIERVEAQIDRGRDRNGSVAR